jgi:sigma-B regulation protein RsbU (phosphoserine phosphatase)
MTDPRGADEPLAPPAATILVVDDNPVNLQVLVRTLDGSGHRILAARDGPSALAIAKRARPELILLDVMMPGQDGFEVCRTLKADEATRESTVIFLSALGEVSDKVLGLTLGAVDYITKPIQPDEVRARVSGHLTRKYLEREVRRSRDRLNRELEGAARMQRVLLPKALPRPAGIRCAAHYRTSRHAGGDYYDVVPLDRSRLGIMVADVSGHGAPAAIVMAMLRATFHAHPDRGDPARLLRDLNAHFEYLYGHGIFATVVYAVLEPESLRMRVACAGHPPPLLCRRSSVAALDLQAIVPLLLMPIDEVPTVDVRLERGDRLLFFTDGITDRTAADGTLYDLDRLSDAFGRAAACSPDDIVQHLVSDIEAFADSPEASDDQTLLVVAMD